MGTIDKGISATPVIFLGLVLIAGIMMLSFSDIDMRIVGGIGTESVLNKLYLEYSENLISHENLLLFYSIEAASVYDNKNSIEEFLEKKLSSNIRIKKCEENYFTIESNYNYINYIENTNIEKNISITKNITCELIERFCKLNIQCDNGQFNCN